MNFRRILGGSLTVATVAAAVVLYTVHPAKSSDHQDTYNLATRSNTSADISDVYVFPAPGNPANVVLAMNVSPIILAGTPAYFDPSLMWQFKISHGAKGGAEDQVIQFGVTGSGAGQTVTLYGPAKPNEVSTSNTFVTPTGSFNYNSSTQFSNGIKVFAGERADPFFFDLFGFFTFLGDRHYALHSGEADSYRGGVGPGMALSNGDNVGAAAKFAPGYDKTANPGTPSFNGFPGRNPVRPRRLRLQHQSLDERARRHRRWVQRALVRHRGSARAADDRFLQLDHQRLGDGQLVDRVIRGQRT